MCFELPEMTILTLFRFQSRAFLLLPMCANIGTIIGPMLGGLTSDPVANYPSLFGGIIWLERFPYALPNIISAAFLFCAVLNIYFGLEEVSRYSFSQQIIELTVVDT